jgi:hypothetical protein
MSVSAPRPFVVLLSTVVVAYVVRALLASPVAWASLLWPALSLGAVFGSRKAAMALGYLFCVLGAMFLLSCPSAVLASGTLNAIGAIATVIGVSLARCEGQ